MKKTKKLLALGLAVSMLLGMTLTVNAALTCEDHQRTGTKGVRVGMCAFGDNAYVWNCPEGHTIDVACDWGHPPMY